jgi:hypothetical protein
MPLFDAVVIRRHKTPKSVNFSIALSDGTGQRSRQQRCFTDHDTISRYSFHLPLTGVSQHPSMDARGCRKSRNTHLYGTCRRRIHSMTGINKGLAEATWTRDIQFISIRLTLLASLAPRPAAWP